MCLNHQKRISRKGAKAQSRSTPRAPVNQGLAFFLCATSAFARNSLYSSPHFKLTTTKES
jgi:hypothetical protein